MTYAIRNSIGLGGMLVLVLASGIYWTVIRQASQIEAFRDREGALQVELEKIQTVLAVYDSTRTGLERLKTRWQSRTQVVPSEDTAARTLAYLNELARASGRGVNFDFLSKGSWNLGTHSVNAYGLEGEARFQNLCAFIWNLEHGRRFYTVDQLEIIYNERELGEPRWDWVTFKMAIRGYYEPDSRIEDLPQSVSLARADLGTGNPFRPHITRTLPANEKGLFEVEGARLEALTREVAFLVDRKGQQALLREGDRVFLGRLSTIDLDKNEARFVLNKGGIVERLELKVDFAGVRQ